MNAVLSRCSGRLHWNLLLAPISASSEDESGAAPQRAAFSRDGYADLAVGVPHEDIGSVQSAGSVNRLYGSAAGL